MAGRPSAHFDTHAWHERRWWERFSITSATDYLQKVIDNTMTPNGVFGTKVHWYQLPVLKERIDPSIDVGEPSPAFLEKALPRLSFIWLRRRDKVAQGVSWLRALETGRWETEDASPPQATDFPQPLFDFDKITACIESLEQLEANWGAYFKRHGIEPLTVFYEDLVGAYEPTLRAILSHIGVTHDGLALPRPRLRRLADHDSLDWIRRYAEHLASLEVDAPIRAPTALGDTSDRSPGAAPSESANAPVTDSLATAGAVPSSAAPAENGALPLIAYCVDPRAAMPIKAAHQVRDWIHDADRSVGDEFLPIRSANRSGWLIVSRHTVVVTWDGGSGPQNLKVEYLSGREPRPARSFAGSGILSWSIPFVFRTPPGYNLLVRGPANRPKDGVFPIEAVIETDWAEATFSMSWMVTRPLFPITFETGEPICMIVPQPRGELEVFAPTIQPLSTKPADSDTPTRAMAPLPFALTEFKDRHGYIDAAAQADIAAMTRRGMF